MIERQEISVWTDGSCNIRTRKGGFGTYILNRSTGEEIMRHRGYLNTTTPRMEMTAIIEALEALPDVPCKVRLVCDSLFVVDFIHAHLYPMLTGVSEISEGAANYDLWMKMADIWKKKPNASIKVVWLKGGSHQDDDMDDDDVMGNNIADGLAFYKQFPDEERIKDKPYKI